MRVTISIDDTLLFSLPIYAMVDVDISLKSSDNFRLLRKQAITIRKIIKPTRRNGIFCKVVRDGVEMLLKVSEAVKYG